MRTIFFSTIRNFIRKPVTNLINLLGLSISLALVMILSVYCYSELTTDQYQENGDRAYLYFCGGNTPGILKEYIDQNIPGVESSVRIAGSWENPVFQVEDKEPITSDLIFADEDFFKLFSFNAVEGDIETALKEPMSIVIRKSLSNKLFGSEKAIGKIIKLDNKSLLKVTAVIQDPVKNSCLSFSSVTSIATRKIIQSENDGEFTKWGWRNFQTFILLVNGTDPNEIVNRISKIIPEEYAKDFKEASLIPFNQIYFSEYKLSFDDYIKNGDKNKIIILVLIAILILLIALINFINISSSQWLEKIKQTGIMKVIGAKKSAILLKMLVEAFLLFLTALIIAFIIVILINQYIQNFTGFHFNHQILFSPTFLFISFAGTFVLSIIFSLFPAVRIASSKAVDNLKKDIEHRKQHFSFKGTLVAAQFLIAIVLIAFTIAVQKQVNFGSSNLGFNQTNLIAIKMTPQLNKKKDVLKKLLLEKPTVKDISFTEYYPGKIISQWSFPPLELNGEKKPLNFHTFSADAGFFEMLKLKLVQGRFYSNDLGTDKGKIVVNETFIRNNKLNHVIGLKLNLGEDLPFEIIGVVKDFHYESVNKPIASLAIRNDSYYSYYCLVNLHTINFSSLYTTIQEIKISTSELSPAFPVEVSFFDQAIENLYHSELQFRRTFSLFAVCAIFICCLGILAMSLSVCQRRIKEIGIRKVNGAKTKEVMVMLNKDFVKWVAIAFVFACPISWYAMHKWLENFAYKTEMSWWIFALAGALAMGIALLTVSWQSWRAARRNPVEALRYE